MVNEGAGNAGGGIVPVSTDRVSTEAHVAAKSQADVQAGKEAAATKAAEEVTFYEESQVPEGLKASFREMKKAYTQKTQDVAEVRKRAEAFDLLAQNPNFNTWATKEFLGESGEGAAGTTTVSPGAETGGYVSEEEQAIKEVSSRQDQLEEQVEIQRNEILLDKLAKKYPDLDKYQPAMWALVQQGTPYEAAYHQAKFGGKGGEELKKMFRDEFLAEQTVAQKAKLEGVGPSSGMLSPTEAKTVAEAFQQAKDAYEKSK
jgi:hypothetical protein